MGRRGSHERSLTLEYRGIVHKKQPRLWPNRTNIKRDVKRGKSGENQSAKRGQLGPEQRRGRRTGQSEGGVAAPARAKEGTPVRAKRDVGQGAQGEVLIKNGTAPHRCVIREFGLGREGESQG